MRFTDDDAGRLALRDGDRVLAEYVYAPTDPQVESPRPYAHLQTIGGADATAYRPADHVWHKGLSLALPVVGDENFWGGPTYVHGHGYVQQTNNGAQVHRGFRHADADGVARVDETLDWIAEDGRRVLVEERALTGRRISDDTWALTWRSALRNVTDDPLGFGSPTSKGRENAGYAGIFWRGPEDWTGGEIVGPDGPAGDAARGLPGPWLAFVAPDRSAGVLMRDAAASDAGDGPPWFARSEEYAGLNPAPFFYTETVLPAGEELVLAAVVVLGTAEVAAHAGAAGELAAEVRAASGPESAAASAPESAPEETHA